jgi:hypothetical protein
MEWHSQLMYSMKLNFYKGELKILKPHFFNLIYEKALLIIMAVFALQLMAVGRLLVNSRTATNGCICTSTDSSR